MKKDHAPVEGARNRDPGRALIGILMLLISPVIFYVFGSQLRDGVLSKSWPQAPGIIEACACRESRFRAGTKHILDLRYSYQVKGQRFVSDRVSPFHTQGEGWVHSKVEAFPEGKLVSVAYNPSDPLVSYLEPGVSWQTPFFLLMGLGAIFGGLLLIYEGAFKSHRSAPADS